MSTNKLVTTVKKPSGRAKHLCRHLRRMFEPRVTVNLKDRGITALARKEVSDALGLSHLILVDARDVKIGVAPEGPTYVFNIVNYDERYNEVSGEHYREDPYITVSGKGDFEEFFLSLSTQPANFKRNIHFHLEGGLVHVRHYAIVTKEEEEDIKVGLNEIGPRITLRLVKTTESFFK